LTIRFSILRFFCIFQLGAIEPKKPKFESGDAAPTAQRIILDIDPETKEVLLEVDPHLATKLKKHQIEGIKFMWNACFESCAAIQKSPNSGSGCILSHCMGLGKTFSIIALVHTLMAHQDRTMMKRVLIVAPKNTIANWQAEFHQWLMFADNSDCIRIFDIYSKQGLINRAAELDEWHVTGGVMLMSYNMFRLLTLECEFNPDADADVQTYIRQALFHDGPDLVVCDEGHLLKNEETQISKAMCRIRTKRKFVKLIRLKSHSMPNVISNFFMDFTSNSSSRIH
jgi:transcriptional regulator ATRX